MSPADASYETLRLTEPEPGIFLVTLNRPERHNAMTAVMFAELERLARAAGEDDACRVVILTGAGRGFCAGYDLADAAEAARLGLVNRVSEPGALLDDALALARQIAANSPAGVRLSKRAIQANHEISSYSSALELENRGQALLAQTTDMPEALTAFMHGRQPRFSGE